VLLIIGLGAATSRMPAATALAQVVLPDTPLHLLVIILISATPRTLANDLAPQIVTIAMCKEIITMKGTIHLAAQGALMEVRRSMQVMSTIRSNLPTERRCIKLAL